MPRRKLLLQVHVMRSAWMQTGLPLSTTRHLRRELCTSRPLCRISVMSKNSLQASETINITDANGESFPEATARRDQVDQAKVFFEKGYKFLYSAEALHHHPVNNHYVPEIIVTGASNVGKSSLLNALVSKPNAARVSKYPGKTTLMNAYGVGHPVLPTSNEPRQKLPPPKHGLVIMDTPGYGYKSQAGWGDNIVAYLAKRKALRGALLLISAEKRLMDEDKWMLSQLAQTATRVMIVITKADKVGSSWRQKCQELAQAVREETVMIERRLGTKLVVSTCATSSDLKFTGNGGGIGGLRLSIMEMAGFTVNEKSVEQAKEATEYSGKIVPFDEIKWKE